VRPLLGAVPAAWAAAHGGQFALWGGRAGGFLRACAPPGRFGIGGDHGMVNSVGTVRDLEVWTVAPSRTPAGAPAVTVMSWHGRYLCCEPDGKVVADRVKASDWERFELLDAGGGCVALATTELPTRRFLTRPDVGSPTNGFAHARADALGDAQRFLLVDAAVARAVFGAVEPGGDLPPADAVAALPAFDPFLL
jgi:hypothetical protein